ncbi:MAG: hypothetical protein ABWJ42_03385 [Sulfolobales archaeon]
MSKETTLDSYVCSYAELCEEICEDLERTCEELIGFLKSSERKSINKCHSCVLRSFFEETGLSEVMYFDEYTLFIKYKNLLIELREDGGEIVPIDQLDEYISDLEDFNLYPREVVERLRSWAKS